MIAIAKPKEYYRTISQGGGRVIGFIAIFLLFTTFCGFPLEYIKGYKSNVNVNGNKRIMEVAQHVGPNTVRCIMLAESEGLHGRCSCLGESSNCFIGHVRALINSNSALSNLHGESHAGGASAFLAVLLGSKLEYI